MASEGLLGLSVGGKACLQSFLWPQITNFMFFRSIGPFQGALVRSPCPARLKEMLFDSSAGGFEG